MQNFYPTIDKAIIEEIKKANTIAIFGHTQPDGDCVMSQLALSYIFQKMGKKTYLFNEGPFIRSDMKSYEPLFLTEVSDEILSEEPLIVVADCSSIDRPGKIFEKVAHLKRIVFDHHSSGSNFCEPELSYIVPSSVSTTLVIEQLRVALDIPLDETLSRYLYIGFCTDTGFYHFLNEVNAEQSLKIVTEYVHHGVVPYEIYDELNDGKTLTYYKTISHLIDKVESLYDGQVLYTYQTLDEDTGDTVSDVIYGQLLTIQDVKVVFFFKEKEDKVVVGMRSKKNSGVDVGQFASLFGGGGHKNASGASLELPLDKAIEKVNQEIGKLLSK